MPEATAGNYDLPCCGCGYNLRGVPRSPDERFARCPECGQVNLDPVALKRLAMERWRCGECGRDLCGPRGLSRVPGSGVLVCPQCGHLHIEMTGIHLNDRACKRDSLCARCGQNLRGVRAPPGSGVITCPECGGWNAYLPAQLRRNIPVGHGREALIDEYAAATGSAASRRRWTLTTLWKKLVEIGPGLLRAPARTCTRELPRPHSAYRRGLEEELK